MPSKSQRAPPTLAQIIAVVVILRRLLVVWGVPPLVVALSPLTVSIWLYGIDRLTAGYGVLSTVIVVLLTAAGRSIIRAHAPSSKHADEAIYKARFILPFLSFVLVRMLVFALIAPTTDALGLDNVLRLTPTFDIIAIMRITAAMTILGLAVVSRYVGPFAVVRCSSFPLVSHPWTISLRTFAARATSFDAFLDLIASPSDTPGILLTSPVRPKEIGRRYQRPTNQAIVAQAIFSSAMGFLVALVQTYQKKPQSPGLFAVCSMACLANLLYCLDGKSHEMNPIKYKRMPPASAFAFSWWEGNSQAFWASVVVVPIVAVVLERGPTLRWLKLGSLFGTAIVVNLYLYTVDTLARLTLCKHKVNLKRLVEELTEDTSTEFTLDAVLSLVLHDDKELIESLAATTKNMGTVLIEEEEVLRNEQAMKKMGSSLIDANGIDGTFETDILRSLTLESIGGHSGDGAKQIMSSTTHLQVIKNWVDADQKLLVVQREPLVIPLVRALCAYTGGMGWALQKGVIKPAQKANQQPKVVPSDYASWFLAPAAVTGVDAAMTGAARFVVFSITNSGNAALDWRSGHLSMMVPVVLCSIFALRKGLLQYISVVKSAPSFAAIRDDASGMQRLHALKDRCEDVAICVLEKLRSLEGLRHVNVNVHDKECRLWVEGLLGVSSDKSMSLAIANQPQTFSFAALTN